MKDYRGEFRPGLELQDLDHKLLARYGRDVMLANHIHDRSGLLPVTLKFGTDAQTQVACDEWMSTSPIYNYRNRQLLNIAGDDVSVALKGFQVDIGAPHNYLKFHYDYVSPTEGYFWTSSCGPFNHVFEISQKDEAMQTQLCHHMEDPTFDATVIAVNPRMRCRPIYRPPVVEVPEKGPCRWLVTIQDDIALAEDCPFLDPVSRTLAATYEFEPLPQGGDGLADYSGEFKRDFCLEDLSHASLTTLCKEFMLDVFLLNYSMYYSVAQHFGEEHLAGLSQEQYHHLAPVTVHRLRETFGIEGDDMGAILKVLQLNPFVPRDYFAMGYAQPGADRGLVWMNDCAAVHEPLKIGLAHLMLTDSEQPGFQRLAREVNPHAVVRAVPVSAVADYADAGQVTAAWEITIDTNAEAEVRSPWADMTGNHMWDIDNSEHDYEYARYDALWAEEGS